MGACTFIDTQFCDTTKVSAKDAFNELREEALHECGHGGYTGTIAEKNSFTMIYTDPLDHEQAVKKADELISNGDPRIDNKWGPAGCLHFDKGWVFFGWASS